MPPEGNDVFRCALIGPRREPRRPNGATSMDIESRDMHRRALAIAVTAALVIAAARAPFFSASPGSAHPSACSDRLELAAINRQDVSQSVSLERGCAQPQCCPPERPIFAPVSIRLAGADIRLATK